jgi:hypothetical protein
MRVDRFFLRVKEKNSASPWWASLESANLALACMYGLLLAEPPLRVVGHPSNGDEAGTETRKTEAGEGDGRQKEECLLKRFGCANDTMVNNHPSPMKGRGQVYWNEEQFAFPLLICNQILYHVFLRHPSSKCDDICF